VVPSLAMYSIVLWTPIAPCKFAEELRDLGVAVWEALATSEVLNICEHEEVDAVVVMPGLLSDGVKEVQKCFICFVLHQTATPAEVLWELTNRKSQSTSIQ